MTDRETVGLITESPYLQFFIGLSGYQFTKAFDASMIVHVRKRIGPDLIKVCNDMTKANGIAMVKQLHADCVVESTESERENLAAIESDLCGKPSSLDDDANWGTLILDATCIPDDIPYPADLRLLNEARETTEAVIDDLLKQDLNWQGRKPLCNREKARNLFLAIIKK